jgi:hypothetical protein
MRHRVYRTGEHTRARSACVPVVRLQAPKISEAVVDFVLFGSPQEFRLAIELGFLRSGIPISSFEQRGLGILLKNAERSARDGARRVLR